LYCLRLDLFPHLVSTDLYKIFLFILAALFYIRNFLHMLPMLPDTAPIPVFE
jgi:hypothetical protein